MTDLTWHRKRSGDLIANNGFKIERLAARRYRLHRFDRQGVRYISDHNRLASAKAKAEMMRAREQAIAEAFGSRAYDLEAQR